MTKERCRHFYIETGYCINDFNDHFEEEICLQCGLVISKKELDNAPLMDYNWSYDYGIEGFERGRVFQS